MSCYSGGNVKINVVNGNNIEADITSDVVIIETNVIGNSYILSIYLIKKITD